MRAAWRSADEDSNDKQQQDSFACYAHIYLLQLVQLTSFDSLIEQIGCFTTAL